MDDYLDALIDESRKDPAFNAAWKEAEARIYLATLRKEKNLTQEEVARKMGVARPRVAELERNPRSVSFGRIIAYASAIGVSVEKIASELHV